ncbi:MAG: hypothetical protein PHN31_00875 [Candidatus Gracilibacteria bacterium]|nr:hypothetical protein [Candidatus Gracilibacteria bacterium]
MSMLLSDFLSDCKGVIKTSGVDKNNPEQIYFLQLIQSVIQLSFLDQFESSTGKIDVSLITSDLTIRRETLSKVLLILNNIKRNQILRIRFESFLLTDIEKHIFTFLIDSYDEHGMDATIAQINKRNLLASCPENSLLKRFIQRFKGGEDVSYILERELKKLSGDKECIGLSLNTEKLLKSFSDLLIGLIVSDSRNEEKIN